MTFLAPLETHSRPNDPVPENRSKTTASLSLKLISLECYIILKIDSLTISFKGLVKSSLGKSIFFPFKYPEIILMSL